MKLIGLKKAVGDYQRANAGGSYSPRYGELMLDTETGKLWTDEFHSLGHNEWIVYQSHNVMNLGWWMLYMNEGPVTMKNVQAFVEKHHILE